MIYQCHRLLRDVRVALDENGVSEPLLREGDVDTLSLDEIIGSKIEEAARRVEEAAPHGLLEGGHVLDGAVYWEDGGRGRLLLPEDFMRLVSFRMSDWERSVHEVLTPESPRYNRLSSRYGGIGGNPQRPVCALVRRPEGRVLEFRACGDEDAYVAEGLYLPYPRVDADGGIDICERCYSAVVYMAAGLTALAYGEGEKASGMMELSKANLS